MRKKEIVSTSLSEDISLSVFELHERLSGFLPLSLSLCVCVHTYAMIEDLSADLGVQYVIFLL